MINTSIQTAGICTILFVLPAAHMCGFQSEAACAAYGAYYDYAVAEGTVTHVVYAGQETPGVVQNRVSSQAGPGPLPGLLYIFFIS